MGHGRSINIFFFFSITVVHYRHINTVVFALALNCFLSLAEYTVLLQETCQRQKKGEPCAMRSPRI